MRINTNNWNRIRYSIYAPIYNVIRGVFSSSRQKSIANLEIQPNHRVLIVGAGTGLDIPFIPSGTEVIATDITPAMIPKILEMANHCNANVKASIMDGQNLDFPDGYFDHVILHLILAVIPDPYRCIQEVDRVTKPGGRVAVFDKFIPAHSKPSFLRKLGNGFTSFLFSDITRDIYEISKSADLQIRSDFPANFKGMFRVILLEK